MAAPANRGPTNTDSDSNNELVIRETPQITSSSSSSAKERAQKDKNIGCAVSCQEVAVTELEPEEPIEDANDDSNKKKKKKEKKSGKQEKMKQVKKSKKLSKENQVKNENSQQDELKSNSTKGNINNDSNKGQIKSSQKPKSLVEDLKLFQNNHLLNQQDPMQQLHIQLNALITNDDGDNNHKRVVHLNGRPFSPSQSNAISKQQYLSNTLIDNENNRLSSNITMQQQAQSNSVHSKIAGNSGGNGQDNFENGENIFTVKKGILWQQQNYDRFHQRLFSRWKKRYFILTTDYLVCFKRSSAKVGRSEMGKFLHKTSLNDVIKVDWLKQKKRDKGAIILHLNRQCNLYLWCKENLDEWMFLIKESVERNKLRRLCIVPDGESGMKHPQPIKNISSHPMNPTNANDDCQLYENTALYTNECSTKVVSRANAYDGIAPLSYESNLEKQSRSIFSQGSPKAIKDNKQRSQHRISDDDSLPNMEENTETHAKNTDTNSTGSIERVTKSIEHEQNKGNSNSDLNRRNESEDNNDAQESARGKGSMMIYDPSDINNDAAINNGGLNRTPKSSPLIGKRDLRSKKGSEMSTSNQRADNLSPKKQSNSPPTIVDGGSKASKRLKETNRVEKSKSGLKDHKLLKDNSTENFRGENERVSAETLYNNIEESNVGAGGKSVDHNTSCDIKSNNIFVNKLADNPNCSNITSGTSGENKVKVQPAIQRPPTNLIRREDSWQSLVSLTRVGKVGPASMQAQRSLYAQHIMPNTNNNTSEDNRINSMNRQGIINIESTVTPSRAPFSFHQQLIRPLPSIRKLRPFPPIGQQHAASFDIAPNSPIKHPNNYPQTSYQHKLLQLQLLHNSNNVDYIRHNGIGFGDNNNDYQIYGPESISTNHYGYSSMRSNLKSAASEFSFIRPSSMTQHTASQSTLPHRNLLHNNFVKLDNQTAHDSNNNQISTKPVQSWLFSSKDGNNNGIRVQKSDDTNTEIGCSQQRGQYLINPLTGERIFDQTALQSYDGKKQAMKAEAIAPFSDLVPPMRELPLKPGKKRVTDNSTSATNGSSLPKSSSLTSSIACFFRRAFSRRSKRGNSKRKATKQAESCSSSLGAFDDNFSGVALAPSAFSTGSKSIDIRKNDQQMQQQQTPQSHRMIDMIEAFNNKTLANGSSNLLPESTQPQYTAPVLSREQEIVGTKNLIRGRSKQPQLQQRAHLNQLGSPLHKSNSISATMGLSHAQELNDRHNFLHDNEVVNSSAVAGGSPMLMRSTKVMSVNLTPLMSQRERSEGAMSSTNQQQFFLSPRNNRQDHQMPRPSSIYGQPSMISSPIITIGVGLDHGFNHNFGVHRNSIHNPHFRDVKSGQEQHNNNLGGFEMIRQQVIKTPFLDTTREVAEEIQSPTAGEPKIHNYDSTHKRSDESLENLGMPRRLEGGRIVEHSSPHGRHLLVDTRGRSFDPLIRASPSSGKLQQKAMVNPIFQSPTMDTIYDNHPMVNAVPELSTHSHYDNHNQLLMDSSNSGNIHRQSPSLRLSDVTQFLPSHSMSAKTSSSDQDRYSKHVTASGISMNNVPFNHQRLSSSELDGAASFDLTTVNKKPSALVAPSTPNYHLQFKTDGTNLAISSPITDHQFSGNRSKLNQGAYSSMVSMQQQQPLPQTPQSRSPMLSRRMGNHHQTGHYQQSPLVSEQTRVLNKGDGIQATIIGDRESYRYTQPVVNIAGAPGINLEPSLAAALLRGTNIDAYESSTFNRNASDSSSSKSNSKTFLVSTRLSKSMAQSGCSGQTSLSKDNNSPTSTFRDESSIASMGNITTCPKSSREELSSSGSRSMTSSTGRSCSRVKVLNASQASSQEEDQQEESSSGDNRSGDNNNSNNGKSKTTSSKSSGMKVREELRTSKLQRQSSDQGISRHRKRRESSSEGSNAESLSDKPEERNWITSKLVE